MLNVFFWCPVDFDTTNLFAVRVMETDELQQIYAIKKHAEKKEQKKKLKNRNN